MFETAMIATTLSVVYLTVWSYKRHDGTMSGVAYLIVAVIATIFIGVEFIFYMVTLFPILHLSIGAGVITAVMTLFITCTLFDELGRRTKANKEKWGNKPR